LDGSGKGAKFYEARSAGIERGSVSAVTEVSCSQRGGSEVAGTPGGNHVVGRRGERRGGGRISAPFVLGAVMLATAAAVRLLQPEPIAPDAQPLLAESVPSQFGEWREVSSVAEQVDPARNADEPSMDRPYDDVLMRTYGNARGDVILLTLAYGRNQRQEVKIHRPDVCYTAQGFQLIRRSNVEFPVVALPNGRRVEGMRMLVSAPGRTEAVSYWIRIGDVFTDNAWAIRYHIFQQGISGRIVDGMLVRASQIVSGPDEAATDRYQLQEQFLADLVRALPPTARRQLVG
jgi:EpsI family protein